MSGAYEYSFRRLLKREYIKGNVVLASELDRRYRNEGIVSISLNPGNIRSDLQRHMGSISRRIMVGILC